MECRLPRGLSRVLILGIPVLVLNGIEFMGRLMLRCIFKARHAKVFASSESMGLFCTLEWILGISLALIPTILGRCGVMETTKQSVSRYLGCVGNISIVCSLIVISPLDLGTEIFSGVAFSATSWRGMHSSDVF